MISRKKESPDLAKLTEKQLDQLWDALVKINTVCEKAGIVIGTGDVLAKIEAEVVRRTRRDIL